MRRVWLGIGLVVVGLHPLVEQNNEDIVLIVAIDQGYNARKVNCGRVYSAYILKSALSGRNL